MVQVAWTAGGYSPTRQAGRRAAHGLTTATLLPMALAYVQALPK